MPAGPRLRFWPAALTALLTLVSGYVDAIGFLHLGQVYIANMSGNSVAVGLHGARLEWAEVSKHGWPIVSFVCGVLVSRLILTWAHRHDSKRAIALVFSLEASFMGAFLAIRSGSAAVFFLVFAMGIQAATIPHIGGTSIYTCFVTGTLVRFGATLADVVWSFWDGGLRAALADPSAPQCLLFASNWSVYVLGAVAGTLALQSIGVSAIWAAFGTIVMYVLLAARAPETLQQFS